LKGSRGNPSGRSALRAGESLLPPGYHLDYSDRDVLTLRSVQDGAVVARFSARGYLTEMIEREAWEHYRRNGNRST
jgi:hypothetical protein